MMNKTIVVVGASQGIGAEIIRSLAKDSSNRIIALARFTKDAHIFEDFKNVQSIKIDLAANNFKDQLFPIFDQLSSIDILINNAGYLVNKPFLEIQKEELINSYQINVLSVFETMQLAVPKMLQKGGHIVNISSMGGFQGTVKFAGLSAYSTSKAAVVSLTELFAEEFKDTNIKANCLCLGAVQTDMLAQAFPGFEAQVSATSMAEYIVDFALNAQKWMHGRVIPVSLTTP